MANGGKFRVTELTFNVSGQEFVVGCGLSAHRDMANVDCGQNTAKTFALPVAAGQLDQLKKDLRAALTKLEALG